MRNRTANSLPCRCTWLHIFRHSRCRSLLDDAKDGRQLESRLCTAGVTEMRHEALSQLDDSRQKQWRVLQHKKDTYRKAKVYKVCNMIA